MYEGKKPLPQGGQCNWAGHGELGSGRGWAHEGVADEHAQRGRWVPVAAVEKIREGRVGIPLMSVEWLLN